MSDKSVVDQIKHYQRDIIKCPDNAKRMIRCIERLMVLPVTIAHLQETGVGRSVNELRKCGGEVGAAANALVCKWKSMVQAEEESDVDSEVEEQEPKESVEVSSPDREDSPPHESYSDEKHKSEPVDKYKKSHDHEENRKPKSDYPLKRNKLSHVENKSKHPDKRHSDKHDHRSHESKSSRSEHGSESDSKLSSSHRSKSGHDSRSSKKYHSSHRSESERNGEIKTDKSSSKNRHDETKSKKSNSSESQSKDVKQKHDKDKPQREDRAYRNEKENQRKEENFHKSVSSSNSSKKYDVRKIESESSDDDEVYKPRSKKRKKSESEEDVKHQKDKYSSRSKHTDSKRHQSSEESDAGNGSEDDENSQPSSRNSEKHHETDNEDESSNRSSPNNLSDNESESNRSYLGEAENENSNLSKASDSDESEASLERKIYVPTKIKKEKESPPRDSNTSSAKTVSDKSKSSHSHSSHSSSHNSSSHSSNKNDKVSSIKKGSSDCVKIKKEKEEHLDLKKKRDDKYNDKKSHKSGKPHSDSSKESNKNEKKVKIKVEKEDDGSIDCVSGASFADALLGLSEPKKKSAKRKSTSSPEKSSKSVEKPVDRKSKNFVKTEPLPSSSPASSSKTGLLKEPELLSKNIKLEPLDVDLKSTLPEISPHYKPLPHYSPPGSPPGKRTKMLSQEEALSTIMSTKNQRTKVYSGNKSGYLKVPSLFDLCIQVLRDNIEALEYTGGVPYDLLKPVLDRATAAQLFQLEHYNPYLVEDTDSLWKFHCNKDFRGKERDEFETWRELYVRLLDERERKLEALKVNISQSMAKNTPVRQTKLAYVDSVVKPPRNIAKKQMKFGTGKAVKHDLVSKALVGAASGSPATPAVPVPAPPASARSSQSSNAFPIPNFLKKKKAPLMQKALQLIKGNRFKR